MSTAKWTITYNADTGSETEASGCGPATAITGVHANNVDSMTKFNLSVDSPTLTGVTTDHILFVDVVSPNTDNDRKFFTIKNVYTGNSTIEVNESTSIQANSLTWAIGGKRKNIFDTIDYNALHRVTTNNDIKLTTTFMPIIELDPNTTSNYLVPSVYKDGIDLDSYDRDVCKLYGPMIFRSSGTDKPILETDDANNPSFFRKVSDNNNNALSIIFENLEFHINNNNGTSAGRAIRITNDARIYVKDCIFTRSINDTNEAIVNGIDGGGNGSQINLVVVNCLFDGTYASGGTDGKLTAGISFNFTGNLIDTLTVIGCTFKNLRENAIRTGDFENVFIENNLIYNVGSDNDGNGSEIKVYDEEALAGRSVIIKNNTIYNASNNGITLAMKDAVEDDYYMGIIYNNIISDCGDFAIGNEGYSANTDQMLVIRNNNFFNNGSDTVEATAFPHALQIDNVSLDPQFTNSSAGDFSVGTNMKGIGYGVSNSENNNKVDLGAAQRSGPEEGGHIGIIRPLISSFDAR
jgi:hypothetical protein